jgi:hypothetical protein
MVMSKTYYVVFLVRDEDKQNMKYNIICVGHHHTLDTRRRQAKHEIQHNICWTSPYTRHYYVVFHVLLVFVSCLVYGDVQHILCCISCFACLRLVSSVCIKYNIIYVWHHHTLDTRRRQAKQEIQHNMCWTSPYTRHETKTSKTWNTT